MPEADPGHWEQLRAGDPAALGAVYEEHVDAVFRFAFRRTASVALAEDVAQATFTAVWRQARLGKLPALALPTARPLLLRIASNECRNLARSSRRRSALHVRLAGRAERFVDDHAGDVSRQVDDERRMTEVRDALAQLPAGQQAAVELVLWEGLTNAEAAQVLGVAEGTVKSRVSRARQRLGELLVAPGQETNR